jgi:hypothetical protein
MQPELHFVGWGHDDPHKGTLQFCGDNNTGFGVLDGQWQRGIEFEEDGTQNVDRGPLFGGVLS